MSDTNFQPGDVLEWRDRIVPGGQITKRMVSFKEWRNNQCIVSWNLTSDGRGEHQLFTVPPENLSKPVPPTLIPAVAARPVPTTIPLSERRATLAHAFAGFKEADEAVVNAQWLLDRALLRMEDVEAHLRRYANLETAAVDSAVRQLRHVNGGSTTHSTAAISHEDDESKWQDRERAKREAGIAEQAYDMLARELSDCRMVFEDRLRLLHKAASFVLAGVVEREVQILAEIERRALEIRAKLRAASLIWVGDAPLPLGEPANVILSNFPYDMGDPVGQRMELTEQRQQVFNDMLTRLMAGEIDADLE